MTTLQPTRRLHASRPAEAGVSVVLVLLSLLFMVVLVFQLDFAAHVESDRALNQVEAVKLRYLAEACLLQAQSSLLLDLEEAEDGASGAGGDPLSNAGEEDGGDDGGPGGSAALDAAQVTGSTDSLLDEWSNSASLIPPMGDDWDILVEVEDEDSKINLLGIWTEDEEIQEEWREIVTRLLDRAFEGTSLDFSALDATDIVGDLDEWASGQRGSFQRVPVPPRKQSQAQDEAELSELDTDIIDREEQHYPLTLRELAFHEKVRMEHLVGFVEDDVFYPGLERYLTIWSELELKSPASELEEDPFGESPLSNNDDDDEEDPDAEDDEDAADNSDLEVQPTLDGRVNVNTAPLAVLRALAPDDIPTSFLETLVEFRERVLEEASTIQEERFSDRRAAADPDNRSLLDDDPEEPYDEEDDPTRFVFQAADEVFDKIEEEMELSVFTDDADRREFESKLGVESQVFTIKITISEPQDPLNPTGLGARRSFRAVIWRALTPDGPRIIPLMPLESYRDPRRIPDDLPYKADELAEARAAFR
ncbi:MAG: hypothetical protein DHS20C15_19010 [Planctomycetota bacterium]|nr:MAG: hypothetical protein DHS20C15_19010 [Planctomycetota bacterium]